MKINSDNLADETEKLVKIYSSSKQDLHNESYNPEPEQIDVSTNKEDSTNQSATSILVKDISENTDSYIQDVFLHDDAANKAYAYITSMHQPFLMPIITFRLNGRSWRMLIDTGSMTTLWPKEILEPGEALLQGELEIRGISGKSIRPLGSSQKLVDLICYKTGEKFPTSIRGLIFNNLSAIKGADGILGMDFLYQNKLQLDLPNHRLFNDNMELFMEEMRIPQHLMNNINTLLTLINEPESSAPLKGEIDIQIVNDKQVRGWSEQIIDIVLPQGARNKELMVEEQWLQDKIYVFASIKR